MPDTETKDLKAAVLELVDDLSSDAAWEDVMYSVYVREAIEAGRKDAAEGRLVDLAEVRRRFGLPE
jgi:predicted transcriptional regulator